MRSRECGEVASELAPVLIISMLVAVICAIGIVGAIFAAVLNHWWPYVAAAVAMFILFKTA